MRILLLTSVCCDSRVDVYQRFSRICCLHIQVILLYIVASYPTAARTSVLTNERKEDEGPQKVKEDNKVSPGGYMIHLPIMDVSFRYPKEVLGCRSMRWAKLVSVTGLSCFCSKSP